MLNMPPEQTKPEKYLDAGLERGAEKLERFLELMAENLRKEGVPADNECRIDMNAFGKIYPDETIQNDKRELKRLQELMRGETGLSVDEYNKKRKSGIGEKMEILKTAIFHKNLSPDFIVARTSHYDDIKGGKDNIIVEKKTGNVVCAFDEVADVFGSRYREKMDNVLRGNIDRNAPRVKYGLKMEKEDGETTLKIGNIKNVPIFYLALSPWLVEEGIRNFNPRLEEQSDYEKILFNEFVVSLNEQIALLKAKKLPEMMQKSILIFEESLRRFSQNK